jgi:hypothetical protein
VIALRAHLTPTGFGPWGDGMARLFLEPTELLLVIALVLLAVQSGRPCTDRLPLLLPLAWLLGGLIGLHLSAELLQAVACTAVVAATGLLVALGVRLRARVLLPSVALSEVPGSRRDVPVKKEERCESLLPVEGS